MRNEWSVRQLDTLVEDILDRRGVTPFKLGSNFKLAGHRVISAKVVKGSRIDLSADEPRFVDRPTFQRWMRTELRADDVILTSEAPLGELAYVAADVDWCLGQRLFAIRTVKHELHGRYLFYALQGSDLANQLQARGTGTTVIGIRQSELRKLEVILPPLAEQKAIAAILGALDDKIDLNRQMNRTLEEMASALFKSWFIDFDPVTAKLEGRQPFGMDAATAGLFPGEFEETAEGAVPKGWSIRSLRDILDINPKRVLKGTEPAPYLEMSNAPTAGHAPSTTALRVPISGVRFMNGDTLLAKITPCLENGKTAFVDFLEEGQVGWGSTEFIVMRSRGSIPLAFAYLLARHPEFRDHAVQSMTGSSGRQRVDVDSLTRWSMAVPQGPAVWAQFDGAVGPWFKMAGANIRESQTLTALRNLLLPLLVSGEVRIKNAEKLVEAAL